MTVLSLAYVIYNNYVICEFDRMFIPEETALIWRDAAVPDGLLNWPGLTLTQSWGHNQDMEQENQCAQ